MAKRLPRRPRIAPSVYKTELHLPHSRYGIDLSKIMPDYIEPIVAYRAWHWNEEGITSLNNVPWAPKVAHVAACTRNVIETIYDTHAHVAPVEGCTCGVYAGINMQHLGDDTDYLHRGIHGEVSLWGRVQVCSLGWRAQYAYPKYFVVPPNMLPFQVTEIQKRLTSLIKYDCDIYLQVDKLPSRDGVKIPLWVKDYGYSQQGISFLIDQAQSRQSECSAIRNLAVDDRVCVLGDNGGIGIVKRIEGKEFYYTLFNPNVIYRKRIRDVKWSDRNWRWETTGLGVTSGSGSMGF
jgi:hypothetical protein